MMSTSEGEGGHEKDVGGCVNFILKIRSKCGQGERGSKNPKNLRTSYLEAPDGGGGDDVRIVT